MENELIQQFKVWQGQASSQRGDFINHLKVHAPWVLAHHPAHSCFREHVGKINGLYICKGCIMTYLGIIAGLIFHTIFSRKRQQKNLAILQVAQDSQPSAKN